MSATSLGLRVRWHDGDTSDPYVPKHRHWHHGQAVGLDREGCVRVVPVGGRPVRPIYLTRVQVNDGDTWKPFDTAVVA